MRTFGKRLAISLAGSWVLLACGNDSSSGGSCSVPAACGGNIVGTWRVLDACLSSPKVLNLDSCPGATATITSLTFSGTITFGADGTEVSTGSESGTASYSFPQTCLTQACSDTGSALSSASASAANGLKVAGVSCSPSGDKCLCSATMSGTVDDHDTYTLAGNQLKTVNGSDGSVDQESYCVQGTQLNTSGAGVVTHAEKQ